MTHERSVLAVLCGMVLISPDGLVLTLLSMSVPTILFVRALFVGCGCLAVLRWRGGKVFSRANWAIGRDGALFAVFSAVGNVCFVTSIRQGDSVHTLLIAASVPTLAGLLEWLVHGVALSTRLWLATLGVLVGVALLVLTNAGPTLILADGCALGAALALAGALTVVPRSDDARVSAAQVLAAVLVVAGTAAWAHPSTTTARDVVLCATFFLVAAPLSMSLVMYTRRQLRATEVSLILLLESVLGPLWLWLGAGEVPTWQTVAAGAIVIASVAFYALTKSSPTYV